MVFLEILECGLSQNILYQNSLDYILLTANIYLAVDRAGDALNAVNTAVASDFNRS